MFTMSLVVVIKEFYAEQATEKQDLMDDPITNYRSGRRSCVISALVSQPLD